MKNNTKILEILESDPILLNHFTRYEEYYPVLTDKYGRFPYYLSNTRDIFEPSVSEFLIKNGFNAPEYDNGKSFAVCLTHDIDHLYQTLFKKGSKAIKSLIKGNIQEFIQGCYSTRSNKIPFCNFKDIIELEEKYDAKSSFFFLSLDEENQDFSYYIDEFQQEIGLIIDHNFEICLHGSRKAYNSSEIIMKEKEKLEKIVGKPIIGFRNHYLCFQVPITWENLNQAGILYDSTLGYPDCAGFRNGMCFPFKPYNLQTGQILDIVEIPLIVMDNTLFSDYMRLDPKIAWDLVQSLIDKTAKSHGVFTIVWHNTFLQKNTHEYKFYNKILEYCSENNGWLTNGEEIFRWWKSHYDTE